MLREVSIVSRAVSETPVNKGAKEGETKKVVLGPVRAMRLEPVPITILKLARQKDLKGAVLPLVDDRVFAQFNSIQFNSIQFNSIFGRAHP